LGKIELALSLGIVGALAVGIYLLATGKLKLPDIFKGAAEPFKFPEFPEWKFPEFQIPELPKLIIPAFVDIFGVNGGAVGVGETITGMIKSAGGKLAEARDITRFEAGAEAAGVMLTPTVQIRQDGKVVATRAPYMTYPSRLPAFPAPSAREIRFEYGASFFPPL